MNQNEGRREELRGVAFFDMLTDEEVRGLAARSQRRLYDAGQVIHAEGDAWMEIFLVVRGSVRLYETSMSGDDVTIVRSTTGELAGLPLITQDVVPLAGLEALEDDTVVYHLPQEYVQQLLLHTPQLMYRVLQEISQRYIALCERASDLALYSIPVRLARELVREVNRCGEDYVAATHEQLAARIGTRRDEVPKVLRTFRERGWVRSRQGRRGLFVIDIDGLSAFGNTGS